MILSRLFRCQRIQRHPRHTSFVFCLKLPETDQTRPNRMSFKAFFFKAHGLSMQTPQKIFRPFGSAGPNPRTRRVKKSCSFVCHLRTYDWRCHLTLIRIAGGRRYLMPDPRSSPPPPTTTNHQPPTTNHQPPTTKPPTTKPPNHQPQPKNAKLVCLNWAEVTVNSNK